MFRSAFGKGSIYETLDFEDRREQPEYELYNSALSHDDPGRYSTADSRLDTSSIQSRAAYSTRYSRHPATNSVYRHFETTLPNLNEEEPNDDVPDSLLVEENPQLNEHQEYYDDNRPSDRELDNMERGMSPRRRQEPNRTPPLNVWRSVDPKERALWRWANTENLDIFLSRVYDYYCEKGIYCILLKRSLNLLTLAFVIGFSTFLMACVDWHKIRGSTKLSEVIIPHGISHISYTASFVLWAFIVYWFQKLIHHIFDIRNLLEMQSFYFHLLEVRDVDIQTISWQEIVHRLMKLRDSHPNIANPNRTRLNRLFSKERMDAHDIANRIMRIENYFIAMINRDILDLSLPVPFLNRRPVLTRALLWNIKLCIMNYVFDEQGQVRPAFVRDTHKRLLADGLTRRFRFFAITQMISAPFIFMYLVVEYFFRYFEEYHRNPGALSSRQYTLFAKWKFREFNELDHIFQKRLDFSHKFASKYIDQFPKAKTAQLSRFVAFVSGSFAAVLVLVTLVDPELFLGFEITKDRTVLFYLTLFGTILAVSRGMIPEENLVFEPEAMLTQVIEYTHYCPNHWKGKLHSEEVKQEFSALYDLKIMIFLEEIFSVLTTPFILWFSLPKCSDKIIEFFRLFTVHVDGIGYVCSQAVFDFERDGKDRNRRRFARPAIRDLKMEQSIMSFRAVHPDWTPGEIEDEDSSAFVNRVNDPLRPSNAYRMGALHQRPSQPFLGFAASSNLGPASRPDAGRNYQGPPPLEHRKSNSGNSPGARSVRPQVAEGELLEDVGEGTSGQKLGSPLVNSFLTPSQAIEDEHEQEVTGNHGVLGMLGNLYQEAGTGKGIGM